MIDIFDLRWYRPMVLTSTPSMMIDPDSGSTMRNRARNMEDLPKGMSMI